MTRQALCFVLSLPFLVASCEERETPDWRKVEGVEDARRTAEAAAAVGGGSIKGEKAGEAAVERGGEEVRFVSANLWNYLVTDRWVDGERVDGKPKPRKQVEALTALFADLKPDVLGVCEIGDEEMLRSFQEELMKVGMEFPHTEHCGGYDNARHLALLSRFPITARNSQRELGYELNGQYYLINRGILDVTVAAGGRELRFIGVHLKSKRPVGYADESEIRMHEAHLLRKHVDEVLEADPQGSFFVYGDFNDTLNSRTIKKVRGRANSSGYIKELNLEDSRGEFWTHFWKLEHVYSRFDYVFPSPGASGLVDEEASRVVDDERVLLGTDHRPLLVIIK